MSGRGDNNKNGTSGQGAGNQSSQGFGEAPREKSNRGEQTGGKQSSSQKKTSDQSSNRNTSVHGKEE